MEAKKSPKAELEKKRLSFILIGLVITLAVVYIAVEWSKRDLTLHDIVAIWSIDDTEGMTPITIREETPPPPPPEAQPLDPLVPELKVVGNEEDTGENLFRSSEDNPKTAINPLPPPVPKPVDVPEEEIDIYFPFHLSKQPSFPGGDAKMKEFLKKNLKYPQISIDNRMEGKVTVGFVVDKDGQLIDIDVIKGVDKHLDAEAIRVVSMMPKWNPGYQLDKPVKVKFNIPITFRL